MLMHVPVDPLYLVIPLIFSLVSSVSCQKSSSSGRAAERFAGLVRTAFPAALRHRCQRFVFLSFRTHATIYV